MQLSLKLLFIQIIHQSFLDSSQVWELLTESYLFVCAIFSVVTEMASLGSELIRGCTTTHNKPTRGIISKIENRHNLIKLVIQQERERERERGPFLKAAQGIQPDCCCFIRVNCFQESVVKGLLLFHRNGKKLTNNNNNNKKGMGWGPICSRSLKVAV